MSKTRFSRSFSRTFYRFISVITLAVLMLSATQFLQGIGMVFAAASLSASKTDALKTDADSSGSVTAGDTLTYTVVIQNSGDTAATNAAYSDTIDLNTTLVGGSIRTTPIARDDSGYSTVGNVQLTVAAPGVLTNDNDPDGTPGLAAVTATTTSANGGNVSVAANGSFSYNPPAGFSGTDTFTYSVQDADSNTDSATVSITVGQVVWFVNNSAAPGDGRFTSPFNSLASFSASPLDEAGDYIFIYQGAGAYTGTLTLLNNQQLIGHGVGLTIAPNLSIAAASRPTVSNLALGSGNTVRGLNVNAASGTGISGASVGTLTINNVSVTNSGGAGVSLGSGALAVTLDSISSTGGTNGVSLSNVTGSFVMNGGTVQNSTGHGIAVSNTSGTMSALTLSNVTVRNAGANGINLEVPPGGSAAFANVTVSNSTIQNNVSTGLRANIQGTGSIGKIDVGSNSFTGNNVGIDLATNGTASIDFDIHNNSALTGTSTQVNIAANDTAHNNGTGPTMEGYIRNNPVVTTSPTGNVYIAMWIVSDGDGDITVEISGNNITNFGDSGIDVESRGGTGDVNARIFNNTATTTATFPLAGMFLRSGNGTPGETSLLCVNASSNSMSAGAGAVADYYLDRFNPASAVFQIQGLVPSPATPAQAEAYIISTDSAPPATAYAETGTYTAATCASVSFAALSGTNQLVRDEGPRQSLTVKAANPGSANILADLGSQAGQFFRSLLSDFAVHTVYANGETVNVTLGTLDPAQQVTITFDVTINDPLSPVGTVQISNQGTVTADDGISTLTDDPDVGGASDPTVTIIDRPDTTVTALDRASGNPTRNSTVTWQVTFADPLEALTASNFSLVQGGGVTGASITSVTEMSGPPSTTWSITANTGSGDGTLGLNMVNDTGLSHDVTNLSFTGQVYAIDKTAPTVTNVTASTAGCLGAVPEYCNATDVVTVQVTFSEVVNVNTSGGTPALSLETGTTDREANYTGGSGTATLNFAYTIQSGDTTADLDYIATSSLALNGGTVQDAATNDATLTLPALGSPGSLGVNEDIVVDTTDPAVSYFHRRSPLTTPTNSDTLQFEVDFSEPIGGPGTIGAGDFDVVGTPGATATVTGIGEVSFGNGTYFVDVSGGDLANYNGTAGISFSASMLITDQAGNPLANGDPLDNETYTVDNDAPTVGMSSATTDPTNISLIPVTVTFSESVTGFTAGDILAGNSTVSNFAGSGANYTFDLTPSGDGLVTADIAAGAAQDTAGNDNTAASQFSRTFDATAPTVNMGSAASDPTNASPIPVSVTFSESVTGFTAGDILAGNGTVSNFAGSGANYTFDLTPSGDGLVTADIAAGAAQDTAGNDNTAASQFSRLYDTGGPTVSMSSAAPDPTNISPIPVSVTFSESVTGFTAGDILTGNGTVNNFAGSGANYTFDLTPSGDGLVTADIAAGAAQDGASNPNSAATQFSRTYDGTVPSVSMSSAAPDPSNTSPIPVTVTFSESVTGFTAGDILAGNGTVNNFAGSGANYTFDLTPSGEGLVTADIAAGAAQDTAGNGNTAAAQFSRTFDATAPDTTITNDPFPSGFTNLTSATFEFTGNDGTGVGGLTFECDLDGGGFSACSSPEHYPGPLADGPHTFSVRAKDSLGNTDATPAAYAWTVDTVQPTATLSSLVTSPTNTSPILVTITFSEPVNIGTGVGDLDITNSSPDPVISGGPTVYTFNLTPSAEGLVTAQYLAGSAIDAAGNMNTVSNLFSITYDTLAPTVTIEQATGQLDPTSTSPVNFTAVFSEAINPASFTGADVALSGDANPTTAEITEIAPNDGTTFNVAVSGMSTSGTVIADILADVVTDLAGNGNAASNSTDNTVTFAGTPILTTDAASDITPSSATLNGSVNANNASTAVTFEYGLDTSYGNVVTADHSPVTGNTDTPVSAAISGLSPNTTYHYRVAGQNMAGTSNGADMTFTTGKVAPTATTEPASGISAYAATLNGTANAFNDDTTLTFEYGLDTSYGNVVTADQSPVTGMADTAVSKAISGLTANITYHYRVVAVNSVGTTYGADMTFITAMGEKTATFKSLANQDGWTLESSEKSGKGGASYNGKTVLKSSPSLRLPPLNNTADLYVGDDLLNSQFRSVLSFNTSSLPDNAVILSVTIKIKRQGVVGTNPFQTHKELILDIRKPFLGSSAGLAPADFQATTSLNNAGMFAKTPIGGWYSANLKPSAFSFVNLGGTTQFRLRFQLDDNNDQGYDYLRFFSGNADLTYRPVLTIEYYVP